MAKRIGMLGGTFDPVHIGHLRSALEVAENYALDQLLLIPNAQPPHRNAPQVSAQQRLEMVQLAVAGVDLLSVDDRELRRDKPSWSIDTLLSLRAELDAQDQLLLILGWDAFCGLPSWHRWEELLEHCHILVLQRPDADIEAPQVLRDLVAAKSVNDPQTLLGPSGQIAFVWQTPLAISATQIRHLLATQRCVRYLVPDTVFQYIYTHQLYQE
ncbi:nicotinate-nucleotide adenylyltransferase [Denitrificimonas caeni]|uniref:Probable nicotinate-nucleotide adenylyltransferase n=1 Tax=Denitrificimonas caeni TaxID=521720 RepID=A0AAE9VQV1_9GAMM|nr:nicotinate-nucleotide adenylyltransferase [Denitrificimonas caeni]NLJ12483.1 nicotinate-nucleotide adenylyltransferase [Gammaproteobacteria bacterium]WBE26423.1 nicotinate-nucleotide adenylyltransferase [Denitrificimonas caeni]